MSVPQIDGVPQVGNTLEMSFAEPPSGALAYQWLRGLASAVAADDTVAVTYTVPAEASVRIRDSAGNAAAGFSRQAVTNATPVANTLPAGQPAIAGTPLVGATCCAGAALRPRRSPSRSR